MFKELEDVIKKVEGNVLTICVSDKLISYFNKNDLVNLYAINNSEKKSIFGKSKKKYKKVNQKGKKVNIKKLKKYIKKKSLNYIFCDLTDIYNYNKYLVPELIYLCNGISYVYFDKKIDIDNIMKKFERYNVNIVQKEFKDKYLLIIDSSDAHNNFFKDKLYFIIDTLNNIADLIGNILVS